MSKKRAAAVILVALAAHHTPTNQYGRPASLRIHISAEIKQVSPLNVTSVGYISQSCTSRRHHVTEFSCRNSKNVCLILLQYTRVFCVFSYFLEWNRLFENVNVFPNFLRIFTFPAAAAFRQCVRSSRKVQKNYLTHFNPSRLLFDSRVLRKCLGQRGTK